MDNTKDEPIAECTPNVELGFLEETSIWRLESRFFPSKVGGKPAWLDLLNLPETKDLRCSNCSQPCIFLSQVYAPVEALSECFHRIIFIFICLNPKCCEGNGQQNFKIFRSQLPRENNFYPYEPPEEKENWRQDITAEAHTKLCHVCGCKSTNVCGKCKKVSYCSKEHQTVDWKADHKKNCGKDCSTGGTGLLIPQFEILIEPEVLLATGIKEDSDNESKQKEIYEKMLREDTLGTLQGDSSVDKDLLDMAATEEDKQFTKFNNRVKHNQDQVLRYEIGATPLWVSDQGLPDTIPNCQYCGGERQFEFQIMPQMLCYLCLDQLDESIDWGVLAVYTCKNNCSDGPAYKSEFLWKQDFNKTNTKSLEIQEK